MLNRNGPKIEPCDTQTLQQATHYINYEPLSSVTDNYQLILKQVGQVYL